MSSINNAKNVGNIFLTDGLLLHFSIDQQLVFIKKKIDRNKKNWRIPGTPNVFQSKEFLEKKKEEAQKEYDRLKSILVDDRPFSKKDDVIEVKKKISYGQMINNPDKNYKKHKDDYKKYQDSKSVAPAEIHVGILRDQVTMANINQYFAGTILQFKGTSEEFIKNNLVAYIGKRITKVKGMLDREDVLIKEWLMFQDVPQNQTIFKLAGVS